MWDTRSIIVRFRRQRGNTNLPGEQKNLKKVRDELTIDKEEEQNNIKDNEMKKKNEDFTGSEKLDSSVLNTSVIFFFV